MSQLLLLKEARSRAATAWAVQETEDSYNAVYFVEMWKDASLLIGENDIEVISSSGEKVNLPHLNYFYQ
jgi:hypothetical protein